ncbi:CHASE2 domain-containing protein [Asticcacaulis sp. SL142]|uniref:CHASE2 domain-containing protein n=1 Tax=Asticcacaulis sp. SL142 TaxID=2995155 RepID=UPI00226CC86F|nr:CHASE2 domain-containing protein [Asticcacaulis sp. SL142]WAC47224.1 CHASE2 domain-containing protein [Asticcacaulis sp. SL142]
MRIILASLVFTLGALLVSKLNILGLDSESKRKSEEIYQRLLANQYQPDKEGAPVSVVYLDDAYANSMYDYGSIRYWPPSYTDYANILTQLTTGLHTDKAGKSHDIKPKAVFLDFIFTGSLVELDREKAGCEPLEGMNYEAIHCGQFRLLEAIEEATNYSAWGSLPECQMSPVNKIECITDAGGIPVILGRVTPEITNRWTPFQSQLALRSVMSTVTVNPREYPTLRWEGEHSERGVAHYDLSPASALFAAHCLSRGTSPDEKCAALVNRLELPDPAPDLSFKSEDIKEFTPEHIPWPAAFYNSQSVVWGAGLKPFAKTAEPADDGIALQHIINRASRVTPVCAERHLWRQIDTALRNHSETTETACLHSLNAPYHDVAGVLPSELVHKLLHNRLVLVGIKDVAGADWILSPVHGNVPGVFLHAMALDNLIKWGPGYRQISGGVFDKSDFIETGLLWALLILGTVGLCFHKRQNLNKNDSEIATESINVTTVEAHAEYVSAAGVERESITLIKVRVEKISWWLRFIEFIQRTNIILYLTMFLFSVSLLWLALFCAQNIGAPEPINWLGVYQTSIGFGIFQMRKEIAASVSDGLKSISQLKPLILHLEGVQRWFNLDSITEKFAKIEAAKLKPTQTLDDR